MTRIPPAWLDDDPEKEHEKSEGMKPDQPMAPVQMALFKARTVLIFGEIDMKVAERVCGQMLAYAQDGNGDIRVIINSQGGHVEAGDTIHDMIRFCGPKVKMIGTGWVASAGAHIFLGAEKQNRFCLPNTRLLQHHTLGNVTRQPSETTF